MKLLLDKHELAYVKVTPFFSNKIYRNNFIKQRSETVAYVLQVEGGCVGLLRSSCSGRLVRAVKSVRATMDSMEPLLRLLPNFRVVHLVRDPRAVALSRIEFDSSGRGLHTDGKVGQLLAVLIRPDARAGVAKNRCVLGVGLFA